MRTKIGLFNLFGKPFLFLLAIGMLSQADIYALTAFDAFAFTLAVFTFPYRLAAAVFKLLFAPFVWLSRLVRWIVGRFRPRRPSVSVTVSVLADESDEPEEWGEEPATDKQIGFIRHLGGNPPNELTKREASELIDRLLAEKAKRQREETTP